MVCGIDEAGRGCLCGSLFVCGVLGEENMLSSLGIKDSKKLSTKQRFVLDASLQELIKEKRLYFYLIEKSAQDIDTFGISVCMKEALESILRHFLDLRLNIEQFLFDGNTTFGIDKKYSNLHTLIKGDEKNLLIAAASIIAKVAKDSQMLQLHKMYPQYDFASNKGYGTAKHKEAINEFGITPFHRKSFRLS